MQMVAFFSESKGLIIHTKDPVGYLSDWEIIPGDKLRIYFHGPEPDIEVRNIPPKIEAAAEYYKQWARQQTWALKRRQNTFSFNLIAVAPNPNFSGQYLSIKKLSETVRPPLGAWITQWRRHAFDDGFPDYEPRDSLAFSTLLSGLKNLQCTAFPYINALLWDDRLKSFTQGEAVALRNRDGSLLQYNKKLSWLKYACPASKVWQDTVVQSRRLLVDSEGMLSSGVYLDMLIAAGPFLCFGSDHGHAPGDPLAWQQGVNSILSATEGMIMSEGNAEIYLNRVDGLLMHLYTERVDTVPLWKLVYGDLTASVGWQMPSQLTPDQLSAEIARAKTFGSSCNGSPWMTHTVQELLLSPNFKRPLLELNRSLAG
ncbi:MAG TPA: DUF6259 domain-containing protein [Nitrospira sp.]|nr:DUF6259 domain-containing protein [Nitrospira sp.]